MADMRGHRFKVVGLELVPYTIYRRDPPGSKNPVIPLQSLDFSILHTIADKLNFTYEMRPPLVEQFGLPLEDGNWTGTVGMLQHQQADFSLVLSPTPGRTQVVDFTRVYASEPLCIISLKPRPLPQHLQLIRPFSGDLWVSVLVSVACWAATLWLLQKAWSSWVSSFIGSNSKNSGNNTSRNIVTISKAFLNSWSVMLQSQYERPPLNITARMLVGWWLVFCLVIAAAYRSSLVAHLTVLSMFPPIDSFQDLLDQDGWTWGLPSTAGSINMYFSMSPDSVTQEVNKFLQPETLENGLERILRGHHSVIANMYTATIVISSRYTDTHGFTPFHISKTSYPVFAGVAWGFRRGAPFRQRFSLIKQRMIESGLIDHWMSEAITAAAKDGEKAYATYKPMASSMSESQGETVLSLQHLQGGFYLLFLGYVFAFLALLQEKALYVYQIVSQDLK
ncbi:glutamate receptor-like isoform X1 [Cherax quadricarinatus]|uniref:glutamate receptor-like isoform X1 n=2 Tax=Cherax quadricarinatus TaxID=27406 RepID=UPI00387E9B38